MLRALRGGAAPEFYVLRRADATNGTQPLLVRSLSAFCEEHELDEEALRGVAQGEADEHDGWTCEAVRRYEPLKAATDADAEDADADARSGATGSGEADEAVEVAEEIKSDESARPAPPPVQKNKMIVGLLAPIAATQALKLFDQTSAAYMLGLVRLRRERHPCCQHPRQHLRHARVTRAPRARHTLLAVSALLSRTPRPRLVA